MRFLLYTAVVLYLFSASPANTAENKHSLQESLKPSFSHRKKVSASTKSNPKKTTAQKASTSKQSNPKKTATTKTAASKQSNPKKTTAQKASTSKKPNLKKASSKKTSNSPITKRSLADLHYQPKKSASQLSRELNRHLADLKTVCDLKENQIRELTKKLQDFRSFLKSSLKDPHMAYKYKLQFGDILSLINEKDNSPPPSSSDFTSSYNYLYNQPEDVKAEDYFHAWAETLLEVFKCMENSN